LYLISKDIGHVPWIDQFKQECLRELTEQARKYGIKVESFDIMDRELEGALGKDLERQAEKVLQNQVEATQVELRNQIKSEEEKGILAVERVKVDTLKAKTDVEYYVKTKEADAKYYSALKVAESEAQASALKATQEAKNIITLAEARMEEIRLQGESYARVPPGHAQQMQLALLELEKRKHLPSGTIWFENSPSTIREGFEVAKGVALAKSY